MQQIIDILKKANLRVPAANDTLRHVFHGTHYAYYGFAMLEGHGMYAVVCGSIIVLLTLNYFLHFDIGG